MSQHDNSTPAFPFHFPPTDGAAEFSCGMTLRDYFAAAAMQGMLFGAVGFIGKDTGDPTPYAHGPCNGAIAGRAWAMADAMLAAKKGTP